MAADDSTVIPFKGLRGSASAGDSIGGLRSCELKLNLLRAEFVCASSVLSDAIFGKSEGNGDKAACAAQLLEDATEKLSALLSELDDAIAEVPHG